MAGGLFGRPFVFNVKCIIFAIMVMAIFLYKPSFRSSTSLYFTLFIIFVVSYVAMAWYDFFFDCSILPLKKGTASLTGLFKPPSHRPKKQEGEVDHKHRLYLIYFSHILLFAPLLIYVALRGKRCVAVAFPILGALAVLTLLYHGMKLTQFVH